jgi:DNA helicase-2/ATP-dependent DNA helicase PcrA
MPQPIESEARAPSAAPRGSIEAEILAGLNAGQREAVTHAGGPLLILAGAGSGKTRAITRRIAWLVRAHEVPPWRILAITFTNKAAGEMRARVEALGLEPGAWIATFHSMCARILRRDVELLDDGRTRDFTIYDGDDRARLLRDLVKAAGYDVTRYKPSEIGAAISARKNGGVRGEEEGTTGFVDEVVARVERDYEAALRARNAFDFDDLLLSVLRLFETRGDVRDAYAERFRHVLVDEYQDTNRVQYELVRHLSSVHGDVGVCGDPDQSIYAWRGADIENILDFEHDFPGARVVRLEQNYRSTQAILDAAQAVIAHNFERKDKALWSDLGRGEKVQVLECADEDDEAREIALALRAAHETGRAWGDCAVFYRVNFMQRALERALRLASIPYVIVAGTEFYERREIKDLVAYLRLAVNPRDDDACVRALLTPARGIGDKTISELERWAADRRVPLLRACASAEARARVRGKPRAELEAFASLIDRLALLASAPAAAALEAVLLETRYDRWLAESAARDEVDREENVRELVSHAHAYDAAEPEGKLRGFLQDIALVSDADALGDDASRVALMTLHAAKGLEFGFVAIAGLEEDLLPHARAVAAGWTRAGGSGVEEERRLFYVGMTRAKERLLLTRAVERRYFGAATLTRPSRFLEEIPPHLIEGGGDERATLGAYAPASVSAAPALREGDLVEHAHFGRGRVELLAGSGANARATVRFELHGSKQLLLQYAGLKRLGGRA